MNHYLLNLSRAVIALCFSGLFTTAFAQTTVTINCTGTTGSYKSGSVNSTGVKSDGNMSVNNVAAQNTPRGWAVFDLSTLAIPAGATVTSASISFSYTTSAGGTGVTCNIYGVASDLSTGTGTALYSSCLNTPSFNSTNWGANTGSTPATVTKAFNASGQTFLQNNLNNTISITFVASSGSNQYTIVGYGGTAATQPQLSITYALPCAGVPNAGTAGSSAANVCSGSSFSLSLTGNSVGSGISIQWESSPAGQNTWLPITGATNAGYTVSGGQTTATDYQAVVTCSNGSASATSNTVAVGMNQFYDCYCAASSTDCTDDDMITNLTFGGISNTTTCGNTNTGYTSYKTTVAPASVMQGVNYPISVAVGTGGTEYAAFWIDYDHSGTFDASEYRSLGSGSGVTLSDTLTIPMTALTGLTGMRVRVRFNTNLGATNTCNNYTYGETEDYLVDIAQNTLCTGTPTAGTASGPAGTCSNSTFNIILTGNTLATGITVQWESSPAGVGTWTQITGATNSSLTITNQTMATDYHVVVTCINGGGVDISNTVAVSQNAPIQCYCVPSYITGCGDDDNINTLTLTGENNTSISDVNTGCSNDAYGDRTNLAAVQLALGMTYSGTMTSDFGSDEYAKIWIDFGDDGFFDPADEVGNVSNVLSTATAYSITIPPTGTLGNHRMRVRLVYDPAAAIDPCNQEDYGETHDYMTMIVLPPSCPAPNNLVDTNTTASSAGLKWNNPGSATTFRIEYGPQGFTPGTGTMVTASASPYTLNGLSAYTPYAFYVRAICSSTDSSTLSGPYNFTTLVANDQPVGAISLTVNGGCTGTPYTNAGATQSTGEPFPGCRQTNGFHSVWFTFTAPASGFVRVTNDYAGGTIGNTRIGVFSTTDATDYSTFSLLACDANNASTVANKSLLYVNGLIPNATYYVVVDGLNNNQATGTFCVTVDEVTSAMISSGGACAAGHTLASLNNSYQGWLSLVDNSGNLIANVRQTNASSASPTGYSVSLNKNTGGVRQAGNQYYLDRNYLISNTGSTTSPSFDVQFYFMPSDLTALQAADPAATLGNLNVTRQTGSSCAANFTTAGGTNSALLQNSNGSVNGINWIQVVTPGFSNFYIMSGNAPLTPHIQSIKASNTGSRNLVTWYTADEQQGDVMNLERSTNGKDFSTIYMVNGKGTASEYAYWDEQPANGMNYYRVKMVSRSGSANYSKVVTAIFMPAASFVQAYPNPVTDKLTVLTNHVGTHASITVTDAMGRLIRNIQPSTAETEIDLSGMAAGFYLVKYEDDDKRQTFKVQKK